MTGIKNMPVHFNMEYIATQAGQPDPKMRRFEKTNSNNENGNLIVEGVTQAQLNAAFAAYDPVANANMPVKSEIEKLTDILKEKDVISALDATDIFKVK